MNFLKALALSLAYLALLGAYLANEMNRHLLGIVWDSFGMTGLTVFYIVLLLKITKRRLSASWFRLRRIESSNIYVIIGVKHFKRVVQKYPFPSSTRRIQRHGRSASALQNLEEHMRDAEETHVFGFLLNIPLAIVFGVLRDIRFLFWLSAFNLLMNLYPIFLQRYNRNRLGRLLGKYKNGSDTINRQI